MAYHRPIPQVHEEELVTATTTTLPKDPRYADTGVLVRPIMRLTNLDFLFVYDRPLGQDVLNRMKKSLGDVLGHYPTLAGRVEGNRICLNNQGAAFRVQSIPSLRSFQEIPEEPPTGEPYCCIPSPMAQNEGRAPLLTITITQLPDGWTLGVAMNHLVADGWAFAMFLKDWSSIFQGKQIEPVAIQIPKVALETYSSPQEAEQAASELLQLELAPWIKRQILKLVFRYIIPPRMRKQDPRTRLDKRPHRLILHYSDKQLKQLKEQATKRAITTWVSTNEALMVHIWTLLLDAAQFAPARRSCLGACLPVNLREKLEGLSKRLAGSVVTNTTMVLDLNDASGDPIERRIHNTIRSRLAPERLTAANRLNNALWKDDSYFQYYYQTRQMGDLVLGQIPGCLHWNWQGDLPYYSLDFGSKCARGIPWSWNHPCTIFPSAEGGVNVYIEDVSIDGRDRGPVSWKRQPSFWGNVRSVSGVMGCLGAVLIDKRPALALLWCAASGLMYLGANHFSERAAAQSKEDFYDYIRAHAHRGIDN